MPGELALFPISSPETNTIHLNLLLLLLSLTYVRTHLLPSNGPRPFALPLPSSFSARREEAGEEEEDSVAGVGGFCADAVVGASPAVGVVVGLLPLLRSLVGASDPRSPSWLPARNWKGRRNGDRHTRGGNR